VISSPDLHRPGTSPAASLLRLKQESNLSPGSQLPICNAKGESET
jgi:hypothetical protein